jgi:hypothetical protein
MSFLSGGSADSTLVFEKYRTIDLTQCCSKRVTAEEAEWFAVPEAKSTEWSAITTGSLVISGSPVPPPITLSPNLFRRLLLLLLLSDIGNLPS